MVEYKKLRDVGPYTVLIDACLKSKNVKKAMRQWREVFELGLIPDSLIYSVTV